MKFEAFRNSVRLTMEDICREILAENRNRIKIKKDNLAVRNLVRIFDAALRISNEKGFASMSLRDLSAETGLSMGALYSYISSKEELIDRIEQGRSFVFRILLDHIQAIDDPMGKLKQGILVHLYLSEVMQPWFYFSYMETKNLPKGEHRKAIEAELYTEQIFVDIIEEGIKRKVFRKVHAQLSASAIKALLQDWYLKRWKYERRKVSVEEYAGFVTDLAASYLKGTGTGA